MRLSRCRYVRKRQAVEDRAVFGEGGDFDDAKRQVPGVVRPPRLASAEDPHFEGCGVCLLLQDAVMNEKARRSTIDREVGREALGIVTNRLDLNGFRLFSAGDDGVVILADANIQTASHSEQGFIADRPYCSRLASRALTEDCVGGRSDVETGIAIFDRESRRER